MSKQKNLGEQLRGRRLAIVFILTFIRAPLIAAAGIIALVNVYAPAVMLITAEILLMCAAAITDAFDGKYARKWNVTSRLGALADPLMDKVFYGITLPIATFIALLNEDLPHAALLLLIDVSSIIRDIWVTFLRSAALKYDADVRAGMAGKLRTALGFPIITTAHLFLGIQVLSMRCEQYEGLSNIPFPVLAAAEIVFFALTVISAVVYTVKYMPYLRRDAEIAETVPQK